jgi:serine/threonine protein kinase
MFCCYFGDTVLVNGSSVKLCDFGLASLSPCDRSVATPLFCAPEILSIGRVDTKADMWSLGVVLFILLCGYPPFLGKQAHASLQARSHLVAVASIQFFGGVYPE